MVVGKAPDRGSQLLKGVLDMCLLAIICEEPSYGYEMVRKLAGRGLDLVSEGTIYPVLSRLQKYYRATDLGKERLELWASDWRLLAAGVERVLGGGEGA
jgi:PadR family transcriptional regulator PadR